MHALTGAYAAAVAACPSLHHSIENLCSNAHQDSMTALAYTQTGKYASQNRQIRPSKLLLPCKCLAIPTASTNTVCDNSTQWPAKHLTTRHRRYTPAFFRSRHKARHTLVLLLSLPTLPTFALLLFLSLAQQQYWCTKWARFNTTTSTQLLTVVVASTTSSSILTQARYRLFSAQHSALAQDPIGGHPNKQHAGSNHQPSLQKPRPLNPQPGEQQRPKTGCMAHPGSNHGLHRHLGTPPKKRGMLLQLQQSLHSSRGTHQCTSHCCHDQQHQQLVPQATLYQHHVFTHYT